MSLVWTQRGDKERTLMGAQERGGREPFLIVFFRGQRLIPGQKRPAPVSVLRGSHSDQHWSGLRYSITCYRSERWLRLLLILRCLLAPRRAARPWPDAQGHKEAHGACAAELPGICDVNLVSHSMGDGISPSAWSRGIFKPEKPTQGAAARAECPTLAAKSAPGSAHSGQNAQVSKLWTRPIACPSRRRNRFLNSCLRFLTPAPFGPSLRTHARSRSHSLNFRRPSEIQNPKPQKFWSTVKIYD